MPLVHIIRKLRPASTSILADRLRPSALMIVTVSGAIKAKTNNPREGGGPRAASDWGDFRSYNSNVPSVSRQRDGGIRSRLS